MRKIIFLTLFLISLLINIPKNVGADLMNPDFLTKKCKPGETEIVTSYRSATPFGPKTYDEGAKYENNSSYYYLTGHGSSFGGEDKWCLKAGAFDNTGSVVLVTGLTVATVVSISFITLYAIRKRNVYN